MTSPATDERAATRPHREFSQLLADAAGVAQGLAGRSAEIESQRRLPLDVVEQLKAAGAFSLTIPKAFGGPELSSLEQFEIIETYARADTAVGWCVMIGCDAGLYSARLDPDIAREMYPRQDLVQAGWVMPIGRAERVTGGFRVSGRWMFGSGCQHSDWLAAGCVVHENGVPVLENGEPMWRIMLARKDDYDILDTWYTTGLAGTGSNDYTCQDLFVPAERSFNLLGPAKQPGLLYAAHDALLRKMSAVPIGAARAALDEAEALLAGKIERPSGTPYKAIPRVQSALAEGESKWGAARSYAVHSIAAYWAALAEGRPPSVRERADLWLSRTNAFQSARDIARLLYDAVGGGAIYRGPFDRFLRDAETMCQHLVGQRKGFEMVGKLLLEPEGAPGHPMI